MCQNGIVLIFLIPLNVVVWTCSCLKPVAEDLLEPPPLKEVRVPFVSSPRWELLWSYTASDQQMADGVRLVDTCSLGKPSFLYQQVLKFS